MVDLIEDIGYSLIDNLILVHYMMSGKTVILDCKYEHANQFFGDPQDMKDQNNKLVRLLIRNKQRILF